ncbi:DUF2303 family protein [Tateyamaria sp.]|uniref:DUF2303 family protein n=1 Tax=Tateyamaria sp. TaxID=1929288 RepID=UPI003B21C904
MTRFDVARTQQPKSTAAYGSLRFGPLRYQLKRTIGMLPTPDNSECSRHEHKAPDGKPLQIPNLIIIAIPVFMGGAPYRMPVRFRYRKLGGEVRFILSIYNPEKAFEAAFKEAVEAATTETDLPTFMGTPES